LSRRKSRPENNFHCFEGVGLPYWRSIAEGFPANKRRLAKGPDGTRWEFEPDVDGYVPQNGGMESPQETKLSPGTYFRFFGTIPHNLHGADGGMSGGWWIDYENLEKVQNFANKCNYSPAQAAAMLLIIPKEWHDCGYLGLALLHKQMKAFVGRGKPAAGGISPASPMRDPSINPVMMSPAHLDVKQYFVPGSREEIAAAFEAQWVKQVIKPGVPIF
jgi:hypothetical protein